MKGKLVHLSMDQACSRGQTTTHHLRTNITSCGSLVDAPPPIETHLMLHLLPFVPFCCAPLSVPQSKTIGEELGIGFLGVGFDPKWRIEDIPGKKGTTLKIAITVTSSPVQHMLNPRLRDAFSWGCSLINRDNA